MNKRQHVAWDERSPAGSNARRHLPRLVSDYFASGRELLAGHPQPAELHALRLATKRLRYTLELFRPCYGPGLGSRIDTLRELQQLLGEVNDTVAAARLLAEALDKKSALRARLTGSLGRRAASKAAEFQQHWTEVFDAPGRERWWTDYLARGAGFRPAQ